MIFGTNAAIEWRRQHASMQRLAAAETYILGDIIVQLNVPHLIPVKVLREQQGQNNSKDQGNKQTEAAAS